MGRAGKTLLVALAALCWSPGASAGYWEIFANGSYFKNNNDPTAGEPSSTISTRVGAGIAYRFLVNTSIELGYSDATNLDNFAQLSTEYNAKFIYKRSTRYQNLSLSLVLDFADKNSVFRPYVRVGGGYMIDTQLTDTTAINLANGESGVLPRDVQITKSASAEGGLGFKIFVADSVAIDLSGTIYATNLDKPAIFLNYSFTGGLRFLF